MARKVRIRDQSEMTDASRSAFEVLVKSNRSWFQLIAFSATVALLVAISLAIFFAGATFAFALARTVEPPVANLADQASAAVTNQLPATDSNPAQTFNGVITDDHCGPRHDMGSDKSPSECAKSCVRNGASFALVDGDKSYTLQGDTTELAKYSGIRVNLNGALEGDTIKVASIRTE